MPEKVYGADPDFGDLTPEQQFQKYSIRIDNITDVSDGLLVQVTMGDRMGDWTGYRSAMNALIPTYDRAYEEDPTKKVHFLINLLPGFKLPSSNNFVAEAAASTKYAPYNSARNRGKIFVQGEENLPEVLKTTVGIVKRVLGFAGYTPVSSPEEAIEKLNAK